MRHSYAAAVMQGMNLAVFLEGIGAGCESTPKDRR
jgi:hypothetical protein